MAEEVKPELDTGHDYDGIRELDNRLPNWWLWTLIGSVVFGYGYWMYYHVINDVEKGAMADFRAEMAEAQAVGEAAGATELDDAGLIALAADPASVDKGRAVFVQYCFACHGAQGQGGIGPNLTDAMWIHDRGRPAGLRTVVATGVAAKGMPAWEPVLGRDRVNQVLSFVLSIRGTNVAGKAPEGEPAAPSGG